MNENVGKIIGERLKATHQTQGWLAEKVGVSINAVSRWIKTGKISRENAIAAAAALELTLDQLLGGAESPQLISPRTATRLERLSEDEDALVQLYRRTTENGQEMIMAQARLMVERSPGSK